MNRTLFHVHHANAFTVRGNLAEPIHLPECFLRGGEADKYGGNSGTGHKNLHTDFITSSDLNLEF